MKKIPFLICMLCLCAAAYSQSMNDLMKQGVTLHDAGRYTEAIAAFQQALAKEPASVAANYEIANTYFAMKKYDEAIDYANKVIASNDKLAADAYTLCGSAQDMLGKFDDALVTYRAGLKKFPNNYLLNYNVALTYFNQKQYGDAEGYAIDAIKCDAQRASSHLILGYCQYNKSKRTEALLCWYNFLMLEPNTKRSSAVLTVVKELLNKGISRKGDSATTISMSSDTKNEFSTAEMILSLTAASRNIEKYKDQTEEEFFAHTNESFFSTVSLLADKKKSGSVWWDVYAPLFTSLNKAKQTETFSYYIQASDSKEAQAWLSSHKKELEQFSEWYNKYHGNK